MDFFDKMKERKNALFDRARKLYMMVKSPSLKVIHGAPLKRAFSFSFIRQKGSMAIEGALVFPVFLFFMMTMLLCLETVRFQSNVMEALHQSGNQKAAQGYLTGYKEGSQENAQENIKKHLRAQTYPYLCIAGEETGVFINDSSAVSENGQIDITAEYEIRPWIFWLPIGGVVFQDRFFGHAFVGYSGKETLSVKTQEEIYVYVTRTGSRYHKHVNCTHLRICVKSVDIAQIPACRNESGEKYYPCERCRPGRKGQVYIAADGNRYHGQSDCSSIKRDVYMIPLREAGAYMPCQKCGF